MDSESEEKCRHSDEYMPYDAAPTLPWGRIGMAVLGGSDPVLAGEFQIADRRNHQIVEKMTRPPDQTQAHG